MLETVVSLIIVGVIAGVSMPLIASAADNAVVARRTRRSADGATFALERVVRLLRDCPGSANSTNITTASASSITFSDGRGLRLSGTDLILIKSAGVESVLATDVTTFQIGYLADDGKTSTLATPASTHRFTIRLVKDSVELQSAAFPRCRAGVP